MSINESTNEVDEVRLEPAWRRRGPIDATLRHRGRLEPPMLDDTTEPTDWDRAVAAHEATLVTGQRVRVMPGEGCRHHGEQEAGITGVIADIDPPGRWKYRPVSTHPYLVIFDRPMPVTTSYMAYWYYCAAELVPIPWPTPEQIVEQVRRMLDDD